MEAYPFDTIWINGRILSIGEILSADATANDGFENGIYTFIRAWFSGEDQFVFHTSGSTGAPKKIMFRREQLIASARMTESTLGLTRGNAALLCLDPSFIAGKMMLVRALVTGMRVIATAPSSNPLMHVDPAVSIDFAALVPLQLKAILRDKVTAARLRSIRSIIVGGADIDEDTETGIRDYPCLVYATYGMTETMSHVALRPVNGPRRSRWFTALAGVSIRQDNRQCCVISWPVLGKEVTTNDIIEQKDARTFRWLGRWDNVINSGGIKILPEQLEVKLSSIMREFDANMTYFVTGAPDATLGQRVVLAVESKLDEERVRVLWQLLNHSLPAFEVPRELRFGSFRYTATGKINRSETMSALQSVMKPGRL